MKKLLLSLILIKVLTAAPIQGLIHDAAKEGNLKLVQQLIENGIDVNQVNYEHNTPLYLATWHRHTEIAKLLVKNGANVNIPDLYGCTPIFWAVINGDIETTKLLISAGTNINVTDLSNTTCIHLAAENNRIEIMLLFLESPFNNHCIIDLIGKTAEDIAREKKHDEIAELLSNRSKSLEQRITRSKYGKLKHLAAISVNKRGITEEEYQHLPYNIRNLIST